MPNQGAITNEKGSVVTGRKLNLTDLLAHCRHYNVNMRKEAVVGLRQLFQKYREDVLREVSKVVDATMMTMLDQEAVVRGECRALLALLLTSPRGALDPFGMIVSVHVKSALTHVSKGVRDDGLRMLDMLLGSPAGRQLLAPFAASLLSLAVTIVVDSTVDVRQQALGIARAILQLQTQASDGLTSSTQIRSLVAPRKHKDGTDQLWAWCLDVLEDSAAESKADAKRMEMQVSLVVMLESLVASWQKQGSPRSAVAERLQALLQRCFPLRVATSTARHRQLLELINLRLANLMSMILGPERNHAESARMALEVASYLRTVAERLPNSNVLNMDSSIAQVDWSLQGIVSLDGQENQSRTVLMLRVMDKIFAACTKHLFSASAPARAELAGALAAFARAAEAVAESESDSESSDSENEERRKSKKSSTWSNEAQPFVAERVILSIPLVAAVLGIRLDCLPEDVMCAAFSNVWARASVVPGTVSEEMVATAATLATDWPKILWYLRDRNPALSHLLICLLLELAKLAPKTRMHEEAWGKCQGMLSLFFVGRGPLPGVLPSLPLAVQQTAVCLLGHFRSFGAGSFVAGLATYITNAMVDQSMCAQVLEILLQHQRDILPLQARLQLILTLLLSQGSPLLARIAADSIMANLGTEAFRVVWQLAEKALKTTNPTMLVAFLRTSVKWPNFAGFKSEEAVGVLRGLLSMTWPDMSAHVDLTSAHPLMASVIEICTSRLEDAATTYPQLVDACLGAPPAVAGEALLGLLFWRSSAGLPSSPSAARMAVQAWLDRQDPTTRLRQLQTLLPSI